MVQSIWQLCTRVSANLAAFSGVVLLVGFKLFGDGDSDEEEEMLFAIERRNIIS